MPNYDPDYTSTGLRLVNTGYIPVDPKADPIQVAFDKFNINTILSNTHFSELDKLLVDLQELLAGNPVFSGLTTTKDLTVQRNLVAQGICTLNSNVTVAGTTLLLSDASFEKAAYFKGVVMLADIANTDSSSQAPNTRWVNRRIKEEINDLGGITLEDLEDYALLDSPTLRGTVKVPTLGFDAALDDRAASLSWVDSFLNSKLKNYISVTGTPTFISVKVTTPPAGVNDDRVVNAFWVNDTVSTQIQNISGTFTALGSTFTNYAADLDDLRLEVEDIQEVKVGTIAIYTGTTIPEGWLEANGSLVDEAVYTAYFSLIGKTVDPAAPAGQFRLPNWGAEIDRLRTLNAYPVGAPLKAIVYVGEAVTV